MQEVHRQLLILKLSIVAATMSFLFFKMFLKINYKFSKKQLKTIEQK